MNLTVILTWEQVLAMSPSLKAVNKTLTLGTLLDSDEGQGSVLLSNLEGLVVVALGALGAAGPGLSGWVVLNHPSDRRKPRCHVP
ncbi:hypothetical protein [Actinomyces oris]|uniref:hypothetical protein n=1 Tax=Actinomyces oris TaxID=544580 RepID=UPI0011784A31|nr:hypothetical protein [Actinomyces oris]